MFGHLPLRLLVAAILFSWFIAPAAAQDSTTRGAPSPSIAGRTPVRVYLHCQSSACSVVVPTEDIPFVDWVRDVANAEVSVLVTQLPSGGGGAEVTVVVADVSPRGAHADTVEFTIPPNASANATRETVARWIRLGLVRTVAAKRDEGLDVRVVANLSSRNEGEQRDPWHRWTITTAGTASLEEQQHSSDRSGSVGAVASKITTDWRIGVGGGVSATTSRNQLSDGSQYRTRTGTYNLGALVVRSVGEHWAIGALGGATHSDFLNEQQVVRLAAAAEYDVFPYSVATHRELTVRYQIGGARYRFQDTTLFGKIRDARASHSVVLAYGTQAVWGSIDSDLTYSSFLTSPSFYAALLEVSANLTVAKGLALNISATAGRVHDQIYIPRTALTDREILAKQKALFTTYHSTLSVGLTYTFGSILSNLVNARFAGTGVTPSGRVPTTGF